MEIKARKGSSGSSTIFTLGTNELIKESLHIGIMGKFGPDVHPAGIVTIDHLTTNAEFNVVEEAETNTVDPVVRVSIRGLCGEGCVDIDAVE